MQTDQLRKHLQLFTEGTAVPDNDLPDAVPAATPVSAGTDMAARLRAAVPKKDDPNIKLVALTPQEVDKYEDIFARLDTLLTKYSKGKKTFENIDFESMTESEQQRFILQNLHLLSEADQMAVLRDLVNEAPGGGIGSAAVDLAKAGFNNVIKPVAKFAYNDVVKPVVGAGYNDIVKPAIQGAGGLAKDFAKGAGKILGYGTVIGSIAGASYFAYQSWDQLFPPSSAIDQMLDPADLAEFRQLKKEYNAVLPDIPEGYEWAIPEDLDEKCHEFEVRYKRFKAAAAEKAREQGRTSPSSDEPGMLDKAKGWLKSKL